MKQSIRHRYKALIYSWNNSFRVGNKRASMSKDPYFSHQWDRCPAFKVCAAFPKPMSGTSSNKMKKDPGSSFNYFES
jgi:hypothetical protein